MERVSFLDYLPLWGVLVCSFIAILAAVLVGNILGKWKASRPEHEPDSSIGPAVGATLAMVGFLIAFAFGLATERFMARKQLLLDEVNAIGTAYLRSELLDEPHSEEIRKLMRQYVSLRIRVVKERIDMDQQALNEVVRQSEEVQDAIWLHAVEVVKSGKSTPVEALFISSLNEMFDLQTSRVVVSRYRFAPVIWYLLYSATILSMFMVGYQMGLSGRTSPGIVAAVTLTFSIILLLVVDLDRTSTGTMRVAQRPMLELGQKMQLQE